MMDKQAKTPIRASGIPRPVSRLPLPTTTASKSLKPSPSREKLQADTGLDIAMLAQSEVQGAAYDDVIGTYSSPRITIRIEHSRRLHTPLVVRTREARDGAHARFDLRAAANGVFFSTPAQREFHSIQFPKTVDGAPLLWNGSRLWRRVSGESTEEHAA